MLDNILKSLDLAAHDQLKTAIAAVVVGAQLIFNYPENTRPRGISFLQP